VYVDLSETEFEALNRLARDVLASSSNPGERRVADSILSELGSVASLEAYESAGQRRALRPMQDSPAIQRIKTGMEHRSHIGAHDDRLRHSGDVGHRRGIRRDPNFLRHVVLTAPGGKYSLWTWDTGRHDSRGQPYIRYAFSRNRRDLFTGDDFAGSPLEAIDSDGCVAALLGFLTLRPGNTDRDYFVNYTPEQMEFAESGDAEYLQSEVDRRFGRAGRRR
jgi:hypothetical protein